MKRLFGLLAIPLGLSLAAPAQASTLPEPGLRAGQTALALGLIDGSVDHGITDRLQLGAGGYFTVFGMAAYGRATWRVFDDTPLGDIGLHVAGGKYNPGLAKGTEGLFVFAGPVLAKQFAGWITLRASLGLMATDANGLTYMSSGPATPNSPRSWGLGGDVAPPVVPNIELAFKLGGNNELTLGGNALIGWRTRL